MKFKELSGKFVLALEIISLSFHMFEYSYIQKVWIAQLKLLIILLDFNS